MTTVQPPPVAAAKDAYARRAWREALERFSEAETQGPLSATDLRAYADAAWWSGEPARVIPLYERAYAAFVAEGDKRGAAGVALDLQLEHRNRHALGMSLAWLRRAEQLVRDDDESPVKASVAMRRAWADAYTGHPESALAGAKAALAMAERVRDADTQAMALMIQGQLLVEMGDVREGMAMVDEATMAAVSGDLGLQTTGMVYCSTISACRDIADYRRASDWTDAAHRWCERSSVTGFPGICRVHRAEIIALRGGFAKAEQEARVACEELQRWQVQPIAAEGYYEIGDIRLRMGDLPSAEDAFRQAHAMGRTPEPGLSLIRLAEGKPQVAHASLRSTLDDTRARSSRARLLPAAVEIAIAADDLAAAHSAADELDEISRAFGTPAIEAAACCARAAVLLADGEAEEAHRATRRAIDLWTQVDAPYEVARARMLRAASARALGDEDDAQLELAAAKTTFERIGARRDARLATEALGGISARAADAPPVSRTFLFTDIVGSTQLVSLIGDEPWKDLIRWHDDVLRAVIAEHGGAEIRHQGDGFAVAFDSPTAAIECAIAIQRRLAEHRHTHGFAPAVRIGVHSADTYQRGLDYAGVGIHEAARVGALAEGGEILVTRPTLDDAGRTFATGSSRQVELKGIAGAVEVVPIVWR